MPYIMYQEKKFSRATEATIDSANRIIHEYMEEGFVLTLRQLYYQFVARGLMANTMAQYNRLGRIVSDARMAGEIDWEAIEDRTRKLEELSHWEDPAEMALGCSRQFRVDRWATQPERVEVWIEKQALEGVFQAVCEKWDVPFFSCRGYASQSSMWRAAERFIEHMDAGQEVVVLHFGDHDPSGIDMTRDIEDRLWTFQADVEVRRVALNMDQVREHAPPPNPAKLTDSRVGEYLRRFGNKSWELDALDPRTLAALVDREVSRVLDRGAWEESEAAIKEGRAKFAAVAKEWRT